MNTRGSLMLVCMHMGTVVNGPLQTLASVCSIQMGVMEKPSWTNAIDLSISLELIYFDVYA